jgi:RNA polymerase sigma-70 factor (ECF subfamily)
MERSGQSDASDEELVSRVQRGEVEAFAAIFERHHRRLGRFLRSCGVPEADIEDLLGETFCRALDRIRQFDVGRGKRYLAYLYSIARNLATDRARGRPPVTFSDEAPGAFEAAERLAEESIVEQICRMEQVRLIRKAMERLSPSDREILTLAYDRDLSCREIQAITGKPSITAVTTHVYKAMKKLRAHVDELAGTPKDRCEA